jgi:hypothetical protein
MVIAVNGRVTVLAQPGHLRGQLGRRGQRRVEQFVEEAVDALAPDQGELPQPGVQRFGPIG